MSSSRLVPKKSSMKLSEKAFTTMFSDTPCKVLVPKFKGFTVVVHQATEYIAATFFRSAGRNRLNPHLVRMKLWTRSMVLSLTEPSSVGGNYNDPLCHSLLTRGKV